MNPIFDCHTPAKKGAFQISNDLERYDKYNTIKMIKPYLSFICCCPQESCLIAAMGRCWRCGQNVSFAINFFPETELGRDYLSNWIKEEKVNGVRHDVCLLIAHILFPIQ